MSADPVRVVVVDDAKEAVDTMATLLRVSGYEVRTAADAPEALELVRQEVPHCVVFDVVLPGMGGDELCRRLRALHGDDIVLIAVSGASDADARVTQSFRLADHFFVKPIDPAALLKVLQPLS